MRLWLPLLAHVDPRRLAGHFAAVVAKFKERGDAIADTPAVVLSHPAAITTVLSLGVVADWTLRHFAKDFREARRAMIATNALAELAGQIVRASGGEVTSRAARWATRGLRSSRRSI